jgi:glycosyltransferase involved in cell wall biosynthesis
MFERMFDSIIIENAEMRDFLVAAGVAQSKIVTVENGIDLDKFSRSALPSASIEEQRSAWGLDPKVKYIVGYIGRMSPEKNPDGFVEIAKGITALRPDVGILIAGDGPMEAAVREAAKSLPPGRVHVQSFIEDVRVPIAACDVLVVPSKVDGRPATVMESAAMGVPVVGSRVGAIHDLIVENETGLTFASGKLNDAVAALEVILSPEVLKIMRIKCREHAVEKFDHRKMFYEYHRIMAPWRFTRPDLPSTDVLMESYPLCAIS